MPGEIAETGALMPGHSEPVAPSRLSPVVHSTTIKHTADYKQNRTVAFVSKDQDALDSSVESSGRRLLTWSCFKFFEQMGQRLRQGRGEGHLLFCLWMTKP